MNAQAWHGGDVRGIARRLGRPIADFIDFSANINPLGPPPAVRAVLREYALGAAVTQYPEPDLPELTGALARARGVEPHNIVVHGGSSALFDAILRACAPRRLGACIPAFAEYARAAAANGLELLVFPLDARSATPFDPDRFRHWVNAAALDAVVLTNPHNPLGFGLPAADLRRLIDALPATTFIVDEAFADYDESVSLVRNAADDSRVIVVRSLTKFYAIPDLRVGYAVMTPQRKRAVARYIPAWPVSGIAAAAATVALSDDVFAQRTRDENARNRAELRRGLANLGVPALPAAANFLTFTTCGVATLRERLIDEHRIIVRDCSTFSGLSHDEYVRVAVRSAADNAALLNALRATLPGR